MQKGCKFSVLQWKIRGGGIPCCHSEPGHEHKGALARGRGGLVVLQGPSWSCPTYYQPTGQC